MKIVHPHKRTVLLNRGQENEEAYMNGVIDVDRVVSVERQDCSIKIIYRGRKLRSGNCAAGAVTYWKYEHAADCARGWNELLAECDHLTEGS